MKRRIAIENFKLVYSIFVLLHIFMLFSYNLNSNGTDEVVVSYIASQVSIITIIILVSIQSIWLLIHFIVFVVKLQQYNVKDIKSFSWFNNSHVLKDSLKIILVTLASLILLEWTTLSRFNSFGDMFIEFEKLITATFSILVIVLLTGISSQIAYKKINRKMGIKLELDFFASLIEETSIKNELNTDIAVSKSIFLNLETKEFINIELKSSQTKFLIRWKESILLKIFKKGTTPPHSIIF